MLDKQKVKELYLEGKNYYSIANILKANPETVRKCIYRNLREFRSSHEAEKIRQKEINRITRYESKSYMSDITFIKKNRSAYKTDIKGNIILDKSVAPIVTFDTPVRLANGNSQSSIDRRIVNSEYRKDNLLFN